MVIKCDQWIYDDQWIAYSQANPCPKNVPHLTPMEQDLMTQLKEIWGSKRHRTTGEGKKRRFKFCSHFPYHRQSEKHNRTLCMSIEKLCLKHVKNSGYPLSKVCMLKTKIELVVFCKCFHPPKSNLERVPRKVRQA